MLRSNATRLSKLHAEIDSSKEPSDLLASDYGLAEMPDAECAYGTAMPCHRRRSNTLRRFSSQTVDAQLVAIIISLACVVHSLS